MVNEDTVESIEKLISSFEGIESEVSLVHFKDFQNGGEKEMGKPWELDDDIEFAEEEGYVLSYELAVKIVSESEETDESRDKAYDAVKKFVTAAGLTIENESNETLGCSVTETVSESKCLWAV